MSISEMWLELRGELQGLWWVPLVGLMGPAPIIALGGITAFLFPLPLFLASLRASRSDKSGPAIALGALLGYLTTFGPVPPLTTLLTLLEASVAIPPALPFVMTSLVMCAYPAYVASRRFRTVPRLLLIAYAGALLASSALWILCLVYPLLPLDPLEWDVQLLLDPAASLLLASACLWRARSGGGEKLLSFLTFYALVGTFR